MEQLKAKFGPQDFHGFLTLQVDFDVEDWPLDKRVTLGALQPGRHSDIDAAKFVIGKNLQTGELVIVPEEYRNASIRKIRTFQTRRECPEIEMSESAKKFLAENTGGA